MRKIILVLCLLLFIGCTNSGVSYSTYNSETLGISFEYPESWLLQANELQVDLATDESLFTANTADFSGGVVANFSALPLEAIQGNLVAALGQFTTYMAANEAVGEVGEVKMLTINGRSAVQSRVAFTEEATLLVTLIQGESQAILVVAGFDDTQYEEMIRHMVESVTFTG